jgi:Zn-dependent protease with chaperone function
MDEIPELYLQQSPISNAMASGTYLPTIALNSRLVEVLDKAGVKAVLGHEAAHVHCHHVLYGTVLGVLGDFVGGFAGGMMPRVLAGLPVSAITFALLGWSRAAEFSADRGAALATRDPDSVCRALMALTAGTAAPHLNLEAFVEQGLTYEEDGSAMIRRIVDVRSTHPLTIRRVRALMDWVGSGEYEQVLGGDYVKRGEEDGFRYEAERAALRYAEELDHLALEEGGESLSEVGEEIDTWLEKTDGEDFDDSAPSDDP